MTWPTPVSKPTLTRPPSHRGPNRRRRHRIPPEDAIWEQAHRLWHLGHRTAAPNGRGKGGWRYSAPEIVRLLDDPRVTVWALYHRAQVGGWARRNINGGGDRFAPKPLRRRCPSCLGVTFASVCPHVRPDGTRCGTLLVEAAP